MITASDLYAISQGTQNQGSLECHWCGSKCDRKWIHDDPPMMPFVHTNVYRQKAKRPGNLFICVGCWMYRRKSVTMYSLSGSWKDRMSPGKCSLWITDEKTCFLDPLENNLLYPLLLAPPLKFSLSFLTAKGKENLLQLQQANASSEVKADTVLYYTIDNVVHTYTIYELEDALRNGADGKGGGVRALINILGSHPLASASGETDEKRGRGRPPAKPTPQNTAKRTVTGPALVSGAASA